jgi:hypothetical protein
VILYVVHQRVPEPERELVLTNVKESLLPAVAHAANYYCGRETGPKTDVERERGMCPPLQLQEALVAGEARQMWDQSWTSYFQGLLETTRAMMDQTVVIPHRHYLLQKYLQRLASSRMCVVYSFVMAASSPQPRACSI